MDAWRGGVDAVLDELFEFPTKQLAIVGDARSKTLRIELTGAFYMKEQQFVGGEAVEIAGVATSRRIEQGKLADVLDQEHPRAGVRFVEIGSRGANLFAGSDADSAMAALEAAQGPG